jgi:hypothetical protein
MTAEAGLSHDPERLGMDPSWKLAFYPVIKSKVAIVISPLARASTDTIETFGVIDVKESHGVHR